MIDKWTGRNNRQLDLCVCGESGRVPGYNCDEGASDQPTLLDVDDYFLCGFGSLPTPYSNPRAGTGTHITMDGVIWHRQHYASRGAKTWTGGDQSSLSWLVVQGPETLLQEGSHVGLVHLLFPPTLDPLSSASIPRSRARNRCPFAFVQGCPPVPPLSLPRAGCGLPYPSLL